MNAPRFKPSTDRPETLGLDRRYTEVIAVARGRHRTLWVALLAAGWNEDDLRQELLVRVIARQAMASRYQPARAGWGKYVFVLTRSILLNLLEGMQSNKARNEVLYGVIHNGERVEVDASLVAVGTLDPWHDDRACQEIVKVTDDATDTEW